MCGSKSYMYNINRGSSKLRLPIGKNGAMHVNKSTDVTGSELALRKTKGERRKAT
jgi:hypothetical protein